MRRNDFDRDFWAAFALILLAFPVLLLLAVLALSALFQMIATGK